jgi:hypothetical protein
VTISQVGGPRDPVNASPIAVTVTFSEPVGGFATSDVLCSNCTVSNSSGSGTSYSFDLVPVGQGLLTATLPAGAAQDAGGNGNTAAAQFRRTYDSVAPVPPGRPTDAGIATSLTAVRFYWTASSDGGSGVASYDLQVGTTPGGSNIFNDTVGSVLWRAVWGANGQRFYARVRARDRAGNVGLWSANSDGILIDTAAPAPPTRPTDAGAFTSSTAVGFNWTAAADVGTSASGVASYALQVGTTPGASNLFNGNVGNVLWRVVWGANDQTLYARARTCDRAGNRGPWSANSDGITVDTVRPRLTSVAPRDYCTLQVTLSEQVVNANQPSNYTVTGGLRVMAVTPLSATLYRLYTSDQRPGSSYTLTVASTVKDRAGNSMDPAYRSRSFTGGRLTSVRPWKRYR